MCISWIMTISQTKEMGCEKIKTPVAWLIFPLSHQFNKGLPSEENNVVETYRSNRTINKNSVAQHSSSAPQHQWVTSNLIRMGNFAWTSLRRIEQFLSSQDTDSGYVHTRVKCRKAQEPTTLGVRGIRARCNTKYKDLECEHNRIGCKS